MIQPSLEFLFYKAPAPLDWSSPRRLLVSSLFNRYHWIEGRFYPHSISHVNVILRLANGETYSRGMALSSSPFGYLYRFLFKGSSLDTLIINLPGKFIEDHFIHGPLEHFRKHGYVETLRVLINDDQARQVQQYFELYQKYGLNRIYGALASSPLKGQGAGCSAFAVSVLEVLGLVTDEIQRAWTRELRVPVDLMASQTKGAKIGFLGFLGGRNSAWAQEQSPHFYLKFWDPEKMFQWNQLLKAKNNSEEFFITTEEGIPHLTWDVTGKPLPAFDLPAHFEGLAPEINRSLSNLGNLWSDQELKSLIKSSNQG